MVCLLLLLLLLPCSSALCVDVFLLLRLLSEEEIDNMKSELEKYGIQMPAFSKIGGILANELSVDEAACERGRGLN